VKHRPSAAAGRMRCCGIAWPVTLRLGVGAHVRWHVRGALGGAGGDGRGVAEGRPDGPHPGGLGRAADQGSSDFYAKIFKALPTLDDFAAMAQMEPQCPAFARSDSRPASSFTSM
jgi:hypothetical protein